MSEIHRVFVTVRNPRGTDPGEVIEGYYRVEWGTVIMCNPDGLPVTDGAGNEWHRVAEPGNEHQIAGRLVREVEARTRKRDSFSRPLHYPPLGVA